MLELVKPSDVDKLEDKIIKSFTDELDLQKHRATGKLIESLEIKTILNKAFGYRIQLHGEAYGEYVDRGRKAGGKRVPIKALMDWIKVKGMASGDKAVKSLAFAIQQKIFKQGIPTFGSMHKALRRKEWIKYGAKASEKDVSRIIEEVTERNLRQEIDRITQAA